MQQYLTNKWAGVLQIVFKNYNYISATFTVNGLSVFKEARAANAILDFSSNPVNQNSILSVVGEFICTDESEYLHSASVSTGSVSTPERKKCGYPLSTKFSDTLRISNLPDNNETIVLSLNFSDDD